MPFEERKASFAEAVLQPLKAASTQRKLKHCLRGRFYGEDPSHAHLRARHFFGGCNPPENSPGPAARVSILLIKLTLTESPRMLACLAG